MSAPRRPFALALTAALALLAGLLLAPAAKAELPPDILDSYTIAVTPQADGMLSIEYTLIGYHAMSDWPSDQPYLQIGVPNGSFAITSFEWKSADVSSVEPVSSNGSFVQFDFGTLPKNGDVFDLRFTINQGRMAYQDPAGDAVTFKFIPAGWTFPITVHRLEVSWANPSDPAALNLVRPSPTHGEKAMTWQWTDPALDSFGMFADCTVELSYSSLAFTLSDWAIGQADNGDGGSGGGSDTGSGSDGGDGWVAILIAAVVAVVGIFGVASGDGYNSGSGLHSGSSGFSGGHSSCACACAGCACACACAGGGKVGCSRKAIGVACLPRVIRSMTDAPH